MKTKVLFILLSNFIIFFRAFSQEIEANSNRERCFAFEVKHIDEFFERFNYENDAFIVKYVRKNYPGISVDRGSLIANLFNRYDKGLKKGEADAFLNQVTDTNKAAYLDFNSGKWYAEASCKFEYNGKLIDADIILGIKQEAFGVSKWMIESAYSQSIATIKGVGDIWNSSHSEKFISSMSYATNFVSLASVFEDRQNIRGYLDDSFYKSACSQAFLISLLGNKVKYRYVRKIRYHFLQVNGWIFTVDRFQRQSINSGWLISKLWRATDKDKESYTHRLMNIRM